MFILLELQLLAVVDPGVVFTSVSKLVSGRLFDMASTEVWAARDAFRTAKSSDLFSEADAAAPTVFRRFEILLIFDGIFSDGFERNSTKLSSASGCVSNTANKNIHKKENTFLIHLDVPGIDG